MTAEVFGFFFWKHGWNLFDGTVGALSVRASHLRAGSSELQLLPFRRVLYNSGTAVATRFRRVPLLGLWTRECIDQGCCVNTFGVYNKFSPLQRIN